MGVTSFRRGCGGRSAALLAVALAVLAATPVAAGAGSRSGTAGKGTLERHSVYSSAVGRRQTVFVYLPPGYRAAAPRRYPVLYLLHGYPGGPGSFVGGVPAGDVQDRLLAQRRMQPLILVMPLGAPDLRTETSWVDGPLGKWETFVARDLVRWVDACFDTNATAAGRGVAGLSDGGFGALNMLIHHPALFRLAETWSGYMHADARSRAIYGGNRRLLAYNSPALQVRRVAARLRRSRAFIWGYIGRRDSAYRQNLAFAATLKALGIDHSISVVPGSHLPHVYRANLPAALQAASSLLSAGPAGGPARPSRRCT